MKPSHNLTPHVLEPSHQLIAIVQSKGSVADQVKQGKRTAENTNAVYEFAYMALDSNSNELELACPVLDPDTGKLLEYCQLHRDQKFKETWERSAANDFGMLAQGVGNRVKGTNTIFFIHKHEVPQDQFKDITYLKFVYNVQLKKTIQTALEPRSMEAVSTTQMIAVLLQPISFIIKILFNSVISTPGARFAYTDLSNFYYNHFLKRICKGEASRSPSQGYCSRMDLHQMH